MAHLHTHRDFEDGILGLAWMGSLHRAGGICDPALNTVRRCRHLSSKTRQNNPSTPPDRPGQGFSTSLNFGSTVSSMVGQLVMGHEIGHRCVFSCTGTYRFRCSWLILLQLGRATRPDGSMFARRCVGELSYVRVATFFGQWAHPPFNNGCLQVPASHRRDPGKQSAVFPMQH